jgi:signal transduction histidine kinase
VVGVALVAGAALLLRAEHNALTDDIETTALLRANDLAATLAGGTVPQDITVAQQDEAVIQILDEQRRVVAASANVTNHPPIANLVAPARGHVALTTNRVPVGDSNFRVVALLAPANNRTYTVYVASSLEPVDRSTQTLARLLVLGLPALLGVVGLVAWFVVGRALRPVEAIRSEVEAISERGLPRRVTEPKANDEIGRLAHTMNVMLGRLEASTERDQRFVADASHELRSPLTSIRAQLEVDLAHPEQADLLATHREVLVETNRLQRLVDDLLALARSDSTRTRLRQRPVDLDDLVLRETKRMREVTDVKFDVTKVSGGQVTGDVDQLTRVVMNLIDNAARHAHSTVTISLDEIGAQVTLSVADDGPGIPTGSAARVFDRFARLDEARGRDAGGSGLGLAIAKEIVLAHHGTIQLEDAGLGARFIVRLPAANEVDSAGDRV